MAAEVMSDFRCGRLALRSCSAREGFSGLWPEIGKTREILRLSSLRKEEIIAEQKLLQNTA